MLLTNNDSNKPLWRILSSFHFHLTNTEHKIKDEKIFMHHKTTILCFICSCYAVTEFCMQNWYEIEKQICYILLFWNAAGSICVMWWFIPLWILSCIVLIVNFVLSAFKSYYCRSEFIQLVIWFYNGDFRFPGQYFQFKSFLVFVIA